VPPNPGIASETLTPVVGIAMSARATTIFAKPPLTPDDLGHVMDHYLHGAAISS
jgi:hypothetical protein